MSDINKTIRKKPSIKNTALQYPAVDLEIKTPPPPKGGNRINTLSVLLRIKVVPSIIWFTALIPVKSFFKNRNSG
jgi:hypothetical protein